MACEEFKEVPASQETLSVADAVFASGILAKGTTWGGQMIPHIVPMYILNTVWRWNVVDIESKKYHFRKIDFPH